MEVESSTTTTMATTTTTTTQVALHPLSIVHMSDQFTRITAGGSLLDTTAPVVGLLFGVDDEIQQSTTSAAPTAGGPTPTTTTTTHVLRIKDADDIPVELSDTSKLQVQLHTAVFPQHRVVGWYRVVSSSSSSDASDVEPTMEDLEITQTLKAGYAVDKSFCFCLLNVVQEETPSSSRDQKTDGSKKNSKKKKKKKNKSVDADTKMKSSSDDEDDGNDDDEDDAVGGTTLNNELPINLFKLTNVNGSTILLNIDNWQLETSDAERIAVEHVMKEQQSSTTDVAVLHEDGGDDDDDDESHNRNHNNPYIVATRTLQHSLLSMKDRIDVMISCLEQMENGTIPFDSNLARQIQCVVSGSLGPLSTLAQQGTTTSITTNDDDDDDVELLTHMALVARTVHAIQSYTEKFRVLQENRTSTKDHHPSLRSGAAAGAASGASIIPNTAPGSGLQGGGQTLGGGHPMMGGWQIR